MYGVWDTAQRGAFSTGSSSYRSLWSAADEDALAQGHAPRRRGSAQMPFVPWLRQADVRALHSRSSQRSLRARSRGDWHCSRGRRVGAIVPGPLNSSRAICARGSDHLRRCPGDVSLHLATTGERDREHPRLRRANVYAASTSTVISASSRAAFSRRGDAAPIAAMPVLGVVDVRASEGLPVPIFIPRSAPQFCWVVTAAALRTVAVPTMLGAAVIG